MDAASEPREGSILGRATELDRIDRLLSAPERTAGLVIDGGRGTGVTTLVRAAALMADDRGLTVLRCVGVEAETGFPYAGLAELLRPVLASVETLAPAQREALQEALDAGDAEPTRVALAVVSLLAEAARRLPVVVCVDEAQWLDTETCAVLATVARRLAHEPVALVVGTHGDDSLPDTGCDHLPVGPLDDAAAAALLDAAEPGLPTLVRARVLHHASGNPLTLIELPSALRGASDGTVLAPFPPLTPRLVETFAPGLDTLAGPPHDAALRLALRGVAHPADALDPVRDAGLVVGDPARFRHPMGRAAVVERATPAARQAAHLAVADDVPEQAPWHRAAAATGPNEDLASALEAAAARALADGDHVRAAHGLRRAARLTPADPARTRRVVLAADALHEIGAWGASTRLLEEVSAADMDVTTRARLVAVRRRIEPGGLAETGGEQLVALASATAAAGDPALAMRLLWRAAAELQALGRAGGAADEIVRAAERLAGDAEMPVLLSVLASLRTHERAAEILAGVRNRVDIVTEPLDHALLGHAALLAGDGALALQALDRAAPRLRDAGRLTLLGQVLTLTAWAALMTGDPARTRRVGAEAARLTADTGLEVWAALGLSATASAAGILGDQDRAEADATAAERVALPAGAAAILVLVQQARAITALSAGRPSEAFEQLQRAFDPQDPSFDRISTPALVGDLAEAASSPEQRRDARQLLASTAAGDAPRFRIAAAHAALVLAEDAEADTAFAAATTTAAGAGPFDEARMLLVHGMRLRRARRVADSRGPLRRAQELFTSVGASPWAERAQRELAATAERMQRDAGHHQLTPQELQIAQLVARGLTNRGIAADLALSPRTVGHHLTHIYRKLGVTSRAGVAGALDRSSG